MYAVAQSPMEITVAHNQQNNVASHATKYVAGVSQSIRVVVRNMADLTVHAVFSAIDRVEKIQWSSNDALILATVPSQGVVHVWAIDDPDWACRIDTGIAGLTDAIFHPTSSRHILVYSEFGLKVDIWDLMDQSRNMIRDVKSHSRPVVSNSKKFALILVRQFGRDHVLVLDLREKFRIVKRIPLHACSDIQSVHWTADDTGFVAIETALKPFVYLFSVNDGTLVSKQGLYEDETVTQLGITSLETTRHNLFAGCFDESLCIFSISAGLTLMSRISFRDQLVNVIDDTPAVLRETLGGEATVRQRNMYQLGAGDTYGYPVEYREVVPDDSGIPGLGQVQLPSVEAKFPRAHIQGKKASIVGPARGGLSALTCSQDGQWVAVQSECKSSVIFLVEVGRLKPAAILVHRQPVRDFKWNPAGLGHRNQLAVLTGDARVFLWTPSMENETVEMKDPTFKPTRSEWSSDGRDLILSEKDRVCSLIVHKNVTPAGG